MEDTTSNAFMNTTIINRSLSDDYYDDNYDYYGIVMYLPSRYYGHVNWAIGTMGNILSFMVFVLHGILQQDFGSKALLLPI